MQAKTTELIKIMEPAKKDDKVWLYLGKLCGGGGEGGGALVGGPDRTEMF